MVNEKNYPGANVTLVGYAGTDAEYPPYDKDGERGISQFRLPIDHGYSKNGEWVKTGTTWFTVRGKTDDIGDIRKGDKVRVENARLESREFERKDKSIGQAFETDFGTITVLEEGSDNSPF